MLSVRPDDFDVSIIITYPGTPYYDEASRHPVLNDVWIYTFEKTGDRLYSYDIDYHQVANYYKGNPDGGYQAYVFTDELLPSDIVELRDFLERNLRKQLDIPFNPSAAVNAYEHSMGQFGNRLPAYILRGTHQGLNFQKQQ